jgi:hypothetical protein
MAASLSSVSLSLQVGDRDFEQYQRLLKMHGLLSFCLFEGLVYYTVKKVSDFSVPKRAVTNQTLPGQIIPGQVSDILLWTGKSVTFFKVYL